MTLQQAHRRAIAFENLDILLGRDIRIDSASVFAKLVTRRRGGYCFEQNRLYADMLGELGFACRPLLARVRLGLEAEATPPRSHVLLLVDLAEGSWIADVGFGGSYVPPLPLVDGTQQETDDCARHRLRRIDGGTVAGDWLLERSGDISATDGRARPDADWQAQYSFDLAEVAADDLLQANHWTATWHESRFVGTPRLSLALPKGFMALNGRSLSLVAEGQREARELSSDSEWREVVSDGFGLELLPDELARLPGD
ncbi:arylamine N-acetyltransferase family protein [Parerythrobacter aestuarii]|uniref:arylamine N-acetyltransferase family protein n=1 Tax=Parerythrobacter aestuarii TaxID=3020909 RepID=UPI0024DE5159|nr:arylamine N-acetyltransferase [Parerythrobacter aestuarii]